MFRKRPAIILTCEHAGNQIPKAWQKQFHPTKDVLNSHRGIDIGAKEIAHLLKNSLGCPYFEHNETRLLIELNRSLHHPKLFSEFSKGFTKEEKQTLIQNLYLPYRNNIEKEIRKKKCPVIHLSMHTFTPVLQGVTRDVDIGLLYDPRRPSERAFCKEFQRVLINKLPNEYRIKLNRPYQGKADGFTTYLRTCFTDDQYLGIEIEVNQKLASLAPVRRAIAKAFESIKTLI